MAATESVPVMGDTETGTTAEPQRSEEAGSPRQKTMRSSLRSIHASSPMQTMNGLAVGADEAEPRAAAAATELEPHYSSIDSGLESLNLRPDPDAQATVTDFLDFTEYLPSDIVRSLTLIGDLDQTYVDASTKVHELTALWGSLPTMAAEERRQPVKLRADISASLRRGLSSRIYAHDEAQRMAKNVNRHYYRAKTILEKLRAMLENYAEAEAEQQEQQEQHKQREQEQKQQQQQQQAAKGAAAAAAGRGPKQVGVARVHRQRVPRITVPGEVLAPYDMEYDVFSDDSDVSSPSSSDESLALGHTAGSAVQPRIKVYKAPGGGLSAAGGLLTGSGAPKPPKVRMPRAPRQPGQPYLSTSSALAQLKPPPENAVIGSADAPWLQLTPYELAKLRKRMKKNAQWTPSETMIARELKALGRNLEAYKEAKKKAEEDGRPFDGSLPEAVMEADGVARAPLGALSVDAALAAEHKQLTNRGMKLNEAKKLKNNLAQLAAQEAEESTRKMIEQARALLSPYTQQNAGSGGAGSSGNGTGSGSGGNGSTATTPATLVPGTADQGSSRQGSIAATRATTPLSRKRKREAGTAAGMAEGTDGGVEKVEGSMEAISSMSSPALTAVGGGSGSQSQSQSQSQRQLSKRVKTETPVPIPQHAASLVSAVPPYPSETPVHPPTMRQYSTTPVPTPVMGPEQPTATAAAMSSSLKQTSSSTSPLSVVSSLSVATVTTTVPLKPPAETPIPPPVHSPRKSTTPIHPPVRELRAREMTRRGERGEREKGEKGETGEKGEKGEKGENSGEEGTSLPGRTTSKPPSRAVTPVVPIVISADTSSNIGAETTAISASITATTTATTTMTTNMTRRPQSRGASVGGSSGGGLGQELEATLASERPRRTSAARLTPGPEAGRTANKRVKRPAPGVISRTNSGGSAAVGRRKAAPRKKRGPQAAVLLQQQQQAETDGDVEVDDEGNVIDADEPRYCVCNRVSFGTMIQCDNVENCRQEWFHLECVGLTAVPARTTKWYCPDCRVLLKIGEKGEVSARGVRM